MMVFISNGKTTCFGLQRPSSGFDRFLAIGVIYIMHKPRGDVEINVIYIYIYICVCVCVCVCESNVHIIYNSYSKKVVKS